MQLDKETRKNAHTQDFSARASATPDSTKTWHGNRFLNWVGRYNERNLQSNQLLPQLEKEREGTIYQCMAADAGFNLDKPLKSGWYMLELMLDLPCAKSIASMHFTSVLSPLQVESFTLPIRSSRLAKRLIYVNSRSHVRFEPFAGTGEFCLRTFRLTRVSASFAHSRIKQKLFNRHPMFYKRLLSSHEKSNVHEVLWADYNALFEKTQHELISYEMWMERVESANLPSVQLQNERMIAWAWRPDFSIILPVYNTPLPFLRACIDSVIAQTYPHWTLCIADDASSEPHVLKLLTEYAENEPRIHLTQRERNGHIVAASNSALALASGDFIVLLDHDDTLATHALWSVAEALQTAPDAQIIYSDEDKLDLHGHRCEPFFKPDWSMDLLRSQNYISHLGVYRRDLITAVGGFRAGFDGSQDYDLLLRCVASVNDTRNILHIPKVLYHWRMSENSAATDANNKSYATEAARTALQEQADKTMAGAYVSVIANGLYRHHWPLPEQPPLVSLLIPTRDKLELIQTCIRSILDKTTYTHFEILILNNGSVQPETLSFFEAIQREDGRVKVLDWNHPFNYSAINNFGAQYAQGDVLGLINNDVEVISPDWLTEMVSHAIRREIGCIGAKLYYPDDTIQHAGVVLGIGGVAGHSHKYFERHQGGYFSQLRVVRNVSAVTGAALLLRKAVFEQVGGLDEDKLKISFNDVDLCLKVQTIGLKNIWTPFAELYHHESKSRGQDISDGQKKRAQAESETMQMRWPNLCQDPYYNVNLSLTHEDYSLSIEPRTVL